MTSELTRTFVNLLHTIRFGCSCPNTIATDKNKGSHTVRVCDPNIYNSDYIESCKNAITMATKSFRCVGPWNVETWAIHPPDRVVNIAKTDTNILAANKPQIYPNYFDIIIIHGKTNEEIIETLNYVNTATTRNGLVVIFPPSKPTRRLLTTLITKLNPMDAFQFEKLNIILGYNTNKNTQNRHLSVLESNKIDRILETYDYTSLNSINNYAYGLSINQKTIADSRSNVNPITLDKFNPVNLSTYLNNESIWTNDRTANEVFDNIKHNKLNPIEPLLAGHLGLLLPVGYLNNKIIHDENNDKDPIIIKGSVEKFEEIVEEHPTKIVTEDTYEVHIKTMNIKTGEINYIGEDDDISLPEFLQTNNAALYNTAKTLFKPSVDITHPDVEQFITRLKSLKRAPVGKQGTTIISLASHLRDNKNAFCIGQQGSGKTFIALGVAAALQYKKVLVMCPTHAVETWRREIKETYPEARVLKPSGISGTTYNDTEIPLDKIDELSTNKVTFILLPKDISKLGFSDRLNLRHSSLLRNAYGKVRVEEYSKPADEEQPEICPVCDHYELKNRKNIDKITSSRRYTVQCTQCGFPLKKLYTCPTCWQPITDINKVINLETGKLIVKKIPKTFQKCQNNIFTNQNGRTQITKCLASHVEPDTDARFHHRIAYGDYIAKYLQHWPDIFIIDELHQYKGKDSLQTAVAGRIAQKVKKTLGLTGTFMGGYASNLYWLFEHFIPRFPEEEIPWNKESTFVENYGKYRHTYKLNRKQFDRMMSGKARKQNGQRTQIPGYHPELLKYILPSSVFVKIYDINRQLQAPKISAEIVPLDINNTYSKTIPSLNQSKAYQTIKTAMEDNAIERVQRGESYNILALIHELVTYPENCWKETEPIDSTTKLPIIKMPEIHIKKDMLFPKEQKLVDIVHKEVVVEKRKCLVYCTHTNEKATWTRIVDILNDHKDLPNVKCAFMNSKGAAETRLSRLEKLAERMTL